MEYLLAGILLRLIQLVNTTSSAARIPEEVSFCDVNSVTTRPGQNVPALLGHQDNRI
jgi:hypothetical protein